MFPITLKFTANNPVELAQISALIAAQAIPVSEATTAKKPTTSAATQDSAANTQRTAAADAETAAPGKTGGATSPTAASAEAEQPRSTAVTEVTLDALKDQFREFCKVRGVPAAQDVLREFGLEKVSLANPAQYAELYQRFGTEG
ncbi:MAG TPA: hypothetical protein PLP74_19155 [Quisquiliibacterium sp.]|nr:hypothetical protein [Quisquiliibacterium sp.]